MKITPIEIGNLRFKDLVYDSNEVDKISSLTIVTIPNPDGELKPAIQAKDPLASQYISKEGKQGEATRSILYTYEVTPYSIFKISTFIEYNNIGMAFYSDKQDLTKSFSEENLVGDVILGNNKYEEFTIVVPEGAKYFAASCSNLDKPDPQPQVANFIEPIDVNSCVPYTKSVEDRTEAIESKDKEYDKAMFQLTTKKNGVWEMDIGKFTMIKEAFVNVTNGGAKGGGTDRANVLALPVNPGEKYKINCRLESNIGYGFYSDGEVTDSTWTADQCISCGTDKVNVYNAEHELTVPEGAKILRISNSRDGGKPETYIEFRVRYVAENNDFCVSDTRIDVKNINDLVDAQLPKIERSYSSIAEFKEFRNMTPKSVTPKRYFNAGNGAIGNVDQDNRCEGSVYSVVPGQKVQIKVPFNGAQGVAFYTSSEPSNGTFIDGSGFTEPFSDPAKVHELIVPEGAASMGVTACGKPISGGGYEPILTDRYVKILTDATKDVDDYVRMAREYRDKKRAGFKFNEFDKAKVIIKFDDNRDTHGYVAKFIKDTYGFPVTFACFPKIIDMELVQSYVEDDVTYTSDYATLKDLLVAIQNGDGEVLMHHGDFNLWKNGYQTETQALDNLKKEVVYYTQNGINGIRGFVTDSHQDSSDYDMQYSKYYDYGTMGGTKALPQFRLRVQGFAALSIEEFQTLIDNLVANKQYLIIYAHSVPEDGFTMANLKEKLDYIQTKVVAGELDVTTVGDLVDTYSTTEARTIAQIQSRTHTA